jgi:hypothetical protein
MTQIILIVVAFVAGFFASSYSRMTWRLGKAYGMCSGVLFAVKHRPQKKEKNPLPKTCSNESENV